jgi:hypothetical protein
MPEKKLEKVILILRKKNSISFEAAVINLQSLWEQPPALQ